MIGRILTMLLVLSLVACDKSSPVQDSDLNKSGLQEIGSQDSLGQLASAPPVEFVPTDEQLRLWSRSCALCHVTGVGGAPKAGDAAAWRPRSSKGQAVLLEHTLNGYNNMPPLGYCMACEKDDFVALINFMTGETP